MREGKSVSVSFSCALIQTLLYKIFPIRIPTDSAQGPRTTGLGLERLQMVPLNRSKPLWTNLNWGTIQNDLKGQVSEVTSCVVTCPGAKRCAAGGGLLCGGRWDHWLPFDHGRAGRRWRSSWAACSSESGRTFQNRLKEKASWGVRREMSTV